MIIGVHGVHAYPTRAAFKINASRGIIDCATTTRERLSRMRELSSSPKDENLNLQGSFDKFGRYD